MVTLMCVAGRSGDQFLMYLLIRQDVEFQNHAQAAAKMLQYSTVMYSISFISCLQMAAEYGGCSQWIMISLLILITNSLNMV